MIADWHSHYPMHIAAGDRSPLELMRSRQRPRLRDQLRAWALSVASHLANYQGPDGGPSVTLHTLRESNVRVALSALYVPFDELDLEVPYGSPPRPGYFEDLLAQMDTVEASLAGQSEVVLAHDVAELDEAVAARKVALIHAVEGGFHLGVSPEAVRANVAVLAGRGVAYITVTHLFWRRMGTNAPALPFLPDWLYRLLFPQPKSGLDELSRAVIGAAVAHGILVDVTHMSAASFEETVRLLDRLDPAGTVPIIASHSAASFGGLAYNLTDEQIRAIARRHGLVGLILCPHYLARGLSSSPKNFQQSVAVLCRHIDRLHDVTGSHEQAAFGSDQDGFIKPALPGLETPAGLGAVEAELEKRYDADIARMICWSNSRRVLGAWGRAPGAAVPAMVAAASSLPGGTDARALQ